VNYVSTIMDETAPGRANQQIAELGRDLIKVLHVEDDPNCREAIADQLSDHGFVVRSFADAKSLADGFAAFSEADIVLLDWDLPDVSGIEVLVALRQCGVDLPVVFLTGYGFTPQGKPRLRDRGRRLHRQGAGR
jgi:CheY-like chemotaxis protein